MVLPITSNRAFAVMFCTPIAAISANGGVYEAQNLSRISLIVNPARQI